MGKEHNWEIEVLEKYGEKIERFEENSLLYKLNNELYVVEKGKLVGKIDSLEDKEYFSFSASEFTKDIEKLRKYK